MKKLVVLTSRIEAHLLVERLHAEQIQALCNGAREYAAIVTGQDVGRYEVQVPEGQYNEAVDLLRSFNVKPVSSPEGALMNSPRVLSFRQKVVISLLLLLFGFLFFGKIRS
jgi:hypothetical protein